MGWLKLAPRVLAAVGVSLVASPFVTLLLVPLWRWLEASHGIEAIGHSGPAAWCYVVVAGVLVPVGLIVLLRRRPGPSPEDAPAPGARPGAGPGDEPRET